jgi:preprotein translocase subunit YajC
MTAAFAHLALGTTSKSSGGSSATLLIFVVVGAAFYFLFFRPQQRKAKALREQGKTFEVGDEVLTAGGLVGHVLDIDGDRVTLETSVGASFVVLKQYVIRTIVEPVPGAEEPDEEAYDSEHEPLDEADDEDDHEPAHETDEEAEPTEDEPYEVTATESTTNGSGTVGESTTDKFWLASDDSEPLPAADGPGTSGGSGRSGRRKRRSAGGTTAGPSGPDSPPST